MKSRANTVEDAFIAEGIVYGARIGLPHFALAQSTPAKYKQHLRNTRRKPRHDQSASTRATLPMPTELKKDELLARIADHDATAMAALFDQLAPLLRGMIQRMIPSPEEAEDVLESLFLRLWKPMGRLGQSKEGPEGVSLEVWLFITARRDAIERHRQGLRQPGLRMSVEEGLAAPWLPKSREIDLLSSRLDLVGRALAQLPKAQRQILDLVLYEGLTEVEIAAALKEPPGKVRDHVRAALSFVRQRLHTLMGTWTADI